MGPTTWAQWRVELARAVRGLDDGEAVLVEAPDRSARDARVPRRVLLPARRVRTRPWVRLARMDDLLRGSCPGAVAIGGTFPWTPDEHADLLRSGWHLSHADGTDYVRFWPDDVPQGPFLPQDDADRAVVAVVRTVTEVFDPQARAEGETGSPTLPTISPG